MKWPLRIVCIILPVAGFVIACILWLSKKEELAEKVLFYSLLGILVNIIMFPILMLLSAC
jgi:hypothetical protein